MPTISSNLPEVEYEITVKERRKVRKQEREWKGTGLPDGPFMDYTPSLDVESFEEREVFSIKRLTDPTLNIVQMIAEATSGADDEP